MDVGGTKTSAVYESGALEKAEPGRLSLHGANYNRDGCVHVVGLIAAALVRIQGELNSECVFRCVAGIAGAGRDDNIRDLEAEFARVKMHPEDRFHALSDAQIAVEAAFAGQPGAIVITGTGSGVLGKNAAGEFVRAGGWGPRLGDIASGEQIGRRALRAVARSLDGGPRTALTEMFEVELEFSDRAKIVQAVYDQNLKLSTLAPYVLEAAEKRDAVALEILQSEAEELAEEARWVLDQMDETRIALVGGLVKDATFRGVLEGAIRHEIPDVVLTEPNDPPEIGALNLAKVWWQDRRS